MSEYTDGDVRRAMEALGCHEETDDLTRERYCPEHSAVWLNDVNACPRAEYVIHAVAPAIAARALREAIDLVRHNRQECLGNGADCHRADEIAITSWADEIANGRI